MRSCASRCSPARPILAPACDFFYMKKKKGFWKRMETHEVFELSARLLDHSVLPANDDAHPAQVTYLGAAYDERVDVESAACKDPRHAR